MTRIWLFTLTFFTVAALALPGDVAQAKPEAGKKVRYRSHTQLDFSGQAIQGKIRAPEVFYIFQRRRSEGHQVVTPPSDFHYHGADLQKTVQEALGK